MSNPDAALAEPLTLGQEKIARGTWRANKVLFLASLAIGLAFTFFCIPVPITRSEADEPAIDMFGAQLTIPSWIHVIAPRRTLMSPWASYWPQFRGEAIRGSHTGAFSSSPASSLSMSCPLSGNEAIPINALQDTLQKYGIASNPIAKFALTQFAATRDVSMAAQAKEEFSRLDPVTQAKFKRLSKEIYVRAGSLKPEELAGATEPMGFWDPLKFSKRGNFAVYRSAELKHGRVCMLAFVGQVVAEKFHPFFDVWGGGPFVSASASHFTPALKENFWPAFWALTAGHEILFEVGDKDPERTPGDFGFDPLSLKPESFKEFTVMQNKELNNGRLAMLAVMGVMAQELATGVKVF